MSSLAFTFCGFQAIHSSHEPFYCLLPYLPLALGITERFMASGRPAWLATLPLVLGLQWTLGHFQIQTWTGGLVVLTGLWRAAVDRRPWRRAVALVLAVIGGAALAAVQLGPSWQFAGDVGQARSATTRPPLLRGPHDLLFVSPRALVRAGLAPAGPRPPPGPRRPLLVRPADHRLRGGTLPRDHPPDPRFHRRRRPARRPGDPALAASSSRSASRWPRCRGGGRRATSTCSRCRGWDTSASRRGTPCSPRWERPSSRARGSTGRSPCSASGWDWPRRSIFGGGAAAAAASWAARDDVHLRSAIGGIPDGFLWALLAWPIAVAVVVLWRSGRIRSWIPLGAVAVELGILYYSGTTQWGWSIAIPGRSPVLAELARQGPVGLVGGDLGNLPVRAGLATAFPYIGFTHPYVNRILVLLAGALFRPGSRPRPSRWTRRCSSDGSGAAG